MTLHIPFDNSYARLPDRFFHRQVAEPVRAPSMIAINAGLARELGIDPDALASAEGVAVLAGNNTPAGADPLAQAYAGHQFGGWVPQLGDGRALLLGEVVDAKGCATTFNSKGLAAPPSLAWETVVRASGRSCANTSCRRRCMLWASRQPVRWLPSPQVNRFCVKMAPFPAPC